LARFFFLDPRARPIYGDWERAALDIVGTLRRAVGRFPDDPALRELIEDLHSAGPDFTRLWALHGVREKATGSKEFVHPAIGRFTLDYEVMAIGDSDQALIVYSAPEGSAGQASLALLATLAPRHSPS
jgi:hypothetical protein